MPEGKLTYECEYCSKMFDELKGLSSHRNKCEVSRPADIWIPTARVAEHMDLRLREHVIAHMSKYKFTLKEVARQTNFSITTLANWLNKYLHYPSQQIKRATMLNHETGVRAWFYSSVRELEGHSPLSFGQDDSEVEPESTEDSKSPVSSRPSRKRKSADMTLTHNNLLSGGNRTGASSQETSSSYSQAKRTLQEQASYKKKAKTIPTAFERADVSLVNEMHAHMSKYKLSTVKVAKSVGCPQSYMYGWLNMYNGASTSAVSETSLRGREANIREWLKHAANTQDGFPPRNTYKPPTKDNTLKRSSHRRSKSSGEDSLGELLKASYEHPSTIAQPFMQQKQQQPANFYNPRPQGGRLSYPLPGSSQLNMLHLRDHDMMPWNAHMALHQHLLNHQQKVLFYQQQQQQQQQQHAMAMPPNPLQLNTNAPLSQVPKGKSKTPTAFSSRGMNFYHPSFQPNIHPNMMYAMPQQQMQFIPQQQNMAFLPQQTLEGQSLPMSLPNFSPMMAQPQPNIQRRTSTLVQPQKRSNSMITVPTTIIQPVHPSTTSSSSQAAFAMDSSEPKPKAASPGDAKSSKEEKPAAIVADAIDSVAPPAEKSS